MTMTTYRELTREEITTLARQYETLRQWEAVQNYALALYGEKAYKVSIETESEYNDEGGYDDRITDITVEDKEGETLYFDPSLPFFQNQEEEELKGLIRKVLEEEYENASERRLSRTNSKKTTMIPSGTSSR